jgi:LacI family transcriptional regulator
MATMKDVARLAGVSIATVSSTLSGRSFVSAELKHRVENAIKELGYARNAMASGLKRGTSSLIGLIVPDITNPFFTELVHCIQQRASEAGFIVLLGVSDDQQSREAELIGLMRSHQVAGTVVIPCGGEEDCLNLSRLAAGMPLVVADNAPPGMAADTVILDNRQAAELATSHLLSLGHKLVATISGPPHRFVSQERFIGFKKALAAKGLSVNPDHVRRGDFHVEAAREAGLALLRSAPRPTAIFVANNQMLIGVMQAVAEAGLSVPRDISIVSIDDFPWAAAFMPALTTVRQPIDAMAEAAIERLKLRIGGLLEDPFRLMLAPELVIRQSCRAPSSGAN